MMEFGLVATADGLRPYGAGILSSRTETVHAIEDPRPHGLPFDLRRVMRTGYRIDSLQQTYFVLDRLDDLFAAGGQDFLPLYAEAEALPTMAPSALQSDNRPIAPIGRQPPRGRRPSTAWRAVA